MSSGNGIFDWGRPVWKIVAGLDKLSQFVVLTLILLFTLTAAFFARSVVVRLETIYIFYIILLVLGSFVLMTMMVLLLDVWLKYRRQIIKETFSLSNPQNPQLFNIYVCEYGDDSKPVFQAEVTVVISGPDKEDTDSKGMAAFYIPKRKVRASITIHKDGYKRRKLTEVVEMGATLRVDIEHDPSWVAPTIVAQSTTPISPARQPNRWIKWNILVITLIMISFVFISLGVIGIWMFFNRPPAVSPNEQVILYYEKVMAREYQETYFMLSEKFRSHQDLGLYEEWWDSVNDVDISYIDIRFQGKDISQVAYRIRYDMKNGKHSFDDLKATLVVDDKRSQWLIDIVE